MKFKDLIDGKEFEKLEKEFDEVMKAELPELDSLLNSNEFDKLQEELDNLNIDDFSAHTRA